MIENKLTKDYLKDFYESLALRLGKSSNGVYNNLLHSKMMKNLSEKYNLQVDYSVLKGGGSSETNFSNNSNNRKIEVETLGHNDKNIKIENLRELNTFKANIEKFQTFYKSKEQDLNNIKNYEVSEKFLDTHFKAFRKSFESSREKHKQALKKVDKVFNENEKFLKAKIEEIVNSNDGRKLRFIDKYKEKLENLENDKQSFKDKISEKREKNEVEKLAKLKENVEATFSNVYGLSLFKTNDDNKLNIIKNHIKKEDSSYVCEAYERVANLSKSEVIKMQVDTLKDKDISFAQINLSKNVLEEWRSNNPKEIELPKKLIGKLKKSLIDGYFNEIKDKTIVDEIKKDNELNKLIDERINIAIKEFQVEDNLSQVMKEMKELKKENKELKKIEIVIEKDNKIVDNFEVAKDEKIIVKEETLKKLNVDVNALENIRLKEEVAKKDLAMEKMAKELERLKNKDTKVNNTKAKALNTIVVNKQKATIKKVVSFVKTFSNDSDINKFNEKINSYGKDLKNIVSNLEIRVSDTTNLKTFSKNGGSYLDLQSILKSKDTKILDNLKVEDIERIDFKDDTLVFDKSKDLENIDKNIKR